MGEREISKNEKLIDILASLLHQAMVTAEFEDSYSYEVNTKETMETLEKLFKERKLTPVPKCPD